MLALALSAMLTPVTFADEDLKKFQGSWKYDSMEVAGKPVDVTPFKTTLLVLKDGKFTQGEAKGTYTINASKTPKTIDLKFTNGPLEGITLRGIYELDETTYKLCSGKPDGARPKTFDSTAKDVGAISVLKKEKVKP
jgi:uncharacterized protein (TIGR03067 family)